MRAGAVIYIRSLNPNYATEEEVKRLKYKFKPDSAIPASSPRTFMRVVPWYGNRTIGLASGTS